MGLLSKPWPGVICLVLIHSLHIITWSSSLWKCPPWEVLFLAGIGTGLGHVSPWTHWVRGGGLVLESTCASSSEPKCVVWLFLYFGTRLGIILRTWSLFQCIQLHLYKFTSSSTILLVQFLFWELCIWAFCSHLQTMGHLGRQHFHRNHNEVYQHLTYQRFQRSNQVAINKGNFQAKIRDKYMLVFDFILVVVNWTRWLFSSIIQFS